jgi:nucleoside-diphosphate-sugar epimerase
LDDLSTGSLRNVAGLREHRGYHLVVDSVKELTGSSSGLIFVPYDEVFGQGIEDMLHRSPSISKIMHAIGWEPERDLETILRDVFAHAEMAPAEFEQCTPTEAITSRQLG